MAAGHRRQRETGQGGGSAVPRAAQPLDQGTQGPGCPVLAACGCRSRHFHRPRPAGDGNRRGTDLLHCAAWPTMSTEASDPAGCRQRRLVVDGVHGTGNAARSQGGLVGAHGVGRWAAKWPPGRRGQLQGGQGLRPWGPAFGGLRPAQVGPARVAGSNRRYAGSVGVKGPGGKKAVEGSARGDVGGDRGHRGGKGSGMGRGTNAGNP